ncbi:uncharacterized protein METZ01_LOCUS73944, partial [marine metagenome]
MQTSKQINLKSRPQGMPAGDNFELVEVEVAGPGDG